AVLQSSSPRLEECLPLLGERAEELAMGIERALAFMAMDGMAGSGVGTLYLSGGGARLPRLADVISDRLRCRVEVANPLQRLRVHPDAGSQVPGDALAPMLMLPIGLALRTAG